MKATRRGPRPRSLGSELATLGIVAPQVMALRGARMARALAGPSGEDQREWQRMHAEKVDAANEALWAMQMAWWRQQQRWAGEWVQAWMQPWRWASTMQQWQARLPADLEALAAQGLAPARRRVEANARRLSRRA